MPKIVLDQPVFSPNAVSAVGDVVRLAIQVTNEDSFALSDASLGVVLSGGLAPVPGTLSVNGQEQVANPFSVKGGMCRLPILASGGTAVVAFDARVESLGTEEPKAFALLSHADTSLQSQIAALRINKRASLACTSASPTVTADVPPSLRLQYWIENDGGQRADNVQVRLEVPTGCRSHDGRRTVLSEAISILPQDEAVVEISLLFDEESSNEIIVVNHADILLDGAFFTAAPEVEAKAPVCLSLSGEFSVSPDTLRHGDVVELRLDVRNGGRGAAMNVPVTVHLPAGVEFIRGSGILGGRPTDVQVEAASCFVSIPRIPRDGIAALSVKGIVQRDLQDASPFHFSAEILGATLEFEASAQPVATFDKDQSYIETDRAVAQPHEPMPFSVVVMNTGNVPAPASLRAESLYVQWSESDGQTRIDYDPVTKTLSKILDLTPIPPGQQRRVHGKTTMPIFIDEAATFEVPIFLKTGDGEESLLGHHSLQGRMAVRFDGSKIVGSSPDPVRFGERRALTFVIVNTGSTIARDVRVELDLPSDILIEQVHGATERDGILRFGHLAAGAPTSATLLVRFDGHPNGAEQRVITGRVLAQRGESLSLEPLQLTVFAEAAIVEPRITIIGGDHDQPCDVEVRFRNAGDGKAGRVQLQTDDLLGYIGQSTTIYGQPVRDIAGASPLQRGLGIDNLYPGEEVYLGWKFFPATSKPIQIGVNFRVDDGDPFVVRSPLYTPVSRIMTNGISFEDSSTVTIDIEKLKPAIVPAVAEPTPLDIPATFSSTPEEVDALAQPSTVFAESSVNAEEPLAPEPALSAGASPPETIAPAAEPIFAEVEEEEKPVPVATQALPDTLAQIIGELQPSAWSSAPVGEPEIPTTAADSQPWWASLESQSAATTPDVITGAVTATLVRRMDESQQTALAGAIDQLIRVKAAGWYRHVMALKLLLPHHISIAGGAGSSSEVATAFQRFRSDSFVALRDARFEMALSTFIPNNTWLSSMQDAQAAKSFHELLTALDTNLSDETAPIELRADAITGTVSKAAVAEALNGNPSELWLYRHIGILVPTQSGNEELASLLGFYVQAYGDFFYEVVAADPEHARETMLMSNAILDDYLLQIFSCLQEQIREAA